MGDQQIILPSGVGVALSARPRGQEGKVGSRTTHPAEFAGCRVLKWHL